MKTAGRKSIWETTCPTVILDLSNCVRDAKPLAAFAAEVSLPRSTVYRMVREVANEMGIDLAPLKRTPYAVIQDNLTKIADMRRGRQSKRAIAETISRDAGIKVTSYHVSQAYAELDGNDDMLKRIERDVENLRLRHELATNIRRKVERMEDLSAVVPVNPDFRDLGPDESKDIEVKRALASGNGSGASSDRSNSSVSVARKPLNTDHIHHGTAETNPNTSRWLRGKPENGGGEG